MNRRFVFTLGVGLAAFAASACSPGQPASPTTEPAPPTATVDETDQTSRPGSTATVDDPDPTATPGTAPAGWGRFDRQMPYTWQTDFTETLVSPGEVQYLRMPRDGIPPVYEPEFVSVDEAGEWMNDFEPVVSVEIDGEVRAYPLQILIWHEVVNDTVAGTPVGVTY